jgi:hypothetical protein
MILNLFDSIELCDWLVDKGLSLEEAAHVLIEITMGDPLSVALMKIFDKRKGEKL